MTQKTNINQPANAIDEQVDLVNDHYLPILLELAVKQDTDSLLKIQKETDRDTFTQSLDATYSVLLHQIYDVCPNLITGKRKDEDDDTNPAVEIFIALFSEPIDPELEPLRQKTKPIFLAVRWLLENRIQLKVPLSLNALKRTLEKYFGDTKTYAQLLIKGDLARNMLTALSVPTISEDDKKQLFEDARIVFGVASRSTDFTQEEYSLRVSATLLNITAASDIVFSARAMLKKSVDDTVSIDDMVQVGEILLPDILGQKDDVLPYLVFPEEQVQQKQTIDKAASAPLNLDIG